MTCPSCQGSQERGPRAHMMPESIWVIFQEDLPPCHADMVDVEEKL